MTAVRSEPPRRALGDKPEGEGEAGEKGLQGRRFQLCTVRHHYYINIKHTHINTYINK